MKIANYLVSLCLLIPAMLCADLEESSYKFQGTHFIAQYFECDFANMADTDMLSCVMDRAVQESGATILSSSCHCFPNSHGLTITYALSESHASLHTYPEHRACFVDLFTCGDHCSYKEFDAVLSAYLKPKRVTKDVILRPDPLDEPVEVVLD